MSKVREEQEVTAGSDALAVSPVKFFETMHAYQRTCSRADDAVEKRHLR